MAIGQDIYNDTRLILAKLETLYTSRPALSAAAAHQQAAQRLLSSWTIDGGIFNRAAQLLPADLPMLNDPRFLKDREAYSGRPWAREAMERMRPEALVEIREGFEVLEMLLGDGRAWVLGTETVGLGDIEGEYWFLSTSSFYFFTSR